MIGVFRLGDLDGALAGVFGVLLRGVVVFRHGNEANAWIVDVKRAWVEDRCATWAIVNPVTNEILGRVAIQVKPAAGSGEISYWVLPTARRSGVATRAVVAATRWAHDVGLHRIEIQHSTANEPSGNVALAAGFTEEGVRAASDPPHRRLA